MQTIYQLTARFPTVDEAGKERLVFETMEFNRDKDAQPWKVKAGTQSYWDAGNPVKKQSDGSFISEKSKKVLKAK